MGAPLLVYDDALQNGFQDWSWATHSLAESSTVHAGAFSVSFEPDAWEAVYFHSPVTHDTTTWEALEFWVHGGSSGGQDVVVSFLLSGANLQTVPLAPYVQGGAVPAGSWASVRIAFDDIGLSGSFNEFWLQDSTGGDQATLYLDDIQYAERGGGPPPGNVTVAVDPAVGRHPINPHVYGVNGDGSSTLPYPLKRWGGNATTRYSWEDDVSNRASDWFFMNIEGGNDPSSLPHGSESDLFIDEARAAGAEPLVTVPIIGWTPIDRTRRWGFSVAKYGAQTNNECLESGFPPWCQVDAGNGIAQATGSPITGNDPTDTSRAVTPVFVTDWMAHIASRVGTAASGGVRYFALDNEPMLWSSTHRDVHPNKLSYLPLWQASAAYAAAMKAQDPDVLIFGPVLWGWCAFYWSDADGCGNSSGPDYTTYGPFLEWYLDEVCDYETQNGIRPVDVLDIHYYPQASGVALSSDESAGTAALRLRSVKDLYDPSYVAESWIGTPVNLIPQMKQLIADHCPGMGLAITEYNWGNDAGLSSALAQVEVLGVLGREDVDVATRWVAPAAGTRVEDAFAMFLDYDGAGSNAFGDSISAVSSDVDAVGAYAVHDPSGQLLLYLINKSTTDESVDVSVSGGIQGDVDLYGFDGASSLGYQGSFTPSATGFTRTLPARSATLAVVELACSLPSAVTGAQLGASGGNLTFNWIDVPDAVDYVVLQDNAPDGMFGVTTGTAASGTTGLTVPAPAGTTYFTVVGRNPCGLGP